MAAPSDTPREPRPPDLRRAGRRRTLLAGKLVYGEHHDLTADCAIRDFSASGARVRISTAIPLPSHLHLIEIRTGLAFACEVAWRRSPEFGLRFTATYDLASSNDRSLWFLKRIWVENAAR